MWIFALRTANYCVRDRSKFTRYLGRVLRKMCLKKVFAPYFLSRKVFAPLLILKKKLSPPPPYIYSQNSLFYRMFYAAMNTPNKVYFFGLINVCVFFFENWNFDFQNLSFSDDENSQKEVNKGAFTKDVRLTPPGEGEGVIEILGRPKAKKNVFAFFHPFCIKEFVQHLEW